MTYKIPVKKQQKPVKQVDEIDAYINSMEMPGFKSEENNKTTQKEE